MAKRKTAKFAVLASAISLMLSCVMLFGSTFAWFTDSVANEGNIIASGTLKVGLSFSDNGTAWTEVPKDASNADVKIFNYDNWEPGYTQVKYLKVENKGTLALKWELDLGASADELAEVIDVYMGTPSSRGDITNMTYVGTLDDPKWEAAGQLLAGQTYDTCITLKMQESAGNEYQEKTIDDITVTLTANQLMYEEDSFGKDYDTNAGLPVAAVYRASEYIDNDAIVWDSLSPTKDKTLDTAYVFKTTETEAEINASPYATWNADFVVSFDRDVTAADGVGLAGQYGTFDWIGLEPDQTHFNQLGGSLVAGQELRLLKDVMGGFYMQYGEFYTWGADEFNCGAWANVATPLTMNVDLRLFETVNNVETGKEITVGSYSYAFDITRADAIQAALNNGGNVVLEADVDLTNAPLTISADTVIDLGGHTLSGSSDTAATSNLIKVASGKKLTLKNGTVSFRAYAPDTDWNPEGFPTYATNTIRCEGELIIDGAIIENKTPAGGASYAIDCYNGADLTVKSGKVIQSGGDVAIRMFGGTTNVTIEGGEISGKRAVWIHVPSNDPNVAPDMNLTVTGGTLTGTQMAVYSYSYGNSFTGVDVNISGGTFNGDVCFGGGYKGDTENVTITGGTFNGELGRYLANDGWEDITVPTP